jgi:hypothetical protein
MTAGGTQPARWIRRHFHGIGYILIVLMVPTVNEFAPAAAVVCAPILAVHPRVGRRSEQAV